MGGIGNQLFQYAVGRQLCEILDCGLEINLDWFQHDSNRRPVFEDFSHPGKRTTSGNSRGRLEHLSNRIRSRFGDRPASHVDAALRIYREKPRQFDPDVLQQPVGTSLRGYFQSPKYFDDIQERVRSEVTDLTKPSPSFNALEAELSHDDSWAALHVRLGDYRKSENLKHHGLLSSRYYAQAIKLVLETPDVKRILLFSDQPDDARKLLPADLPIEVFPDTPGLSDLEALLTMSLANAVIMANSTFSWWAAFLGDRPSRRVIAPRPWFVSVSIRDLLLPHWISIGR